MSKGLTFNLGHLMRQLGVRNAARNNDKSQGVQPQEYRAISDDKDDKSDAAQQFNAEPEQYSYSKQAQTPAGQQNQQALRQMIERLKE